jgi:hypothetical protein
MFNGEERVRISTDASEEEFDEKLRDALEPLGQLDITERGVVRISAKTSIASFLSTVTITGKIKKADDGYRVNVQYSISPSPVCWIGAVALFFFLCMIGGVVIFAPLILDKPNVARAVENALRDLKDSFNAKKRQGRSSDDD